jgi:23S rRNA pseudouridine2605 synthase
MEYTRLNKALSMLGICSRRKADSLIINGQIKVNGEIVKNLGAKISEEDLIFFNEKSYFLGQNTPESRVWLYYKRNGLVTTHKDEKKRRTVFEDVRDRIPCRVISVGRLDINSEGLLLLTNNAEFAHFAESPKNKWKRKYKVRVFGSLTEQNLKTIREGIMISGVQYTPIEISRARSIGCNTWYECILSEGKNREIRRIFGYFGILVNRLIRVQYGPYSLSDMRPGEIRYSKIVYNITSSKSNLA